MEKKEILKELEKEEYVRKGVISLSKNEKEYVLSNFDTGIKARFKLTDTEIAVKNFMSWANISRSRWA